MKQMGHCILCDSYAIARIFLDRNYDLFAFSLQDLSQFAVNALSDQLKVASLDVLCCLSKSIVKSSCFNNQGISYSFVIDEYQQPSWHHRFHTRDFFRGKGVTQ